jgi:hypothetical protein
VVAFLATPPGMSACLPYGVHQMFQIRIGLGMVQESRVIRKTKAGDLMSEPIVVITLACGTFAQELKLPGAMADEIESKSASLVGQFALYQAADAINYKNEVGSTVKRVSDIRFVDAAVMGTVAADPVPDRDCLSQLFPKSGAKAGAA